MDDYEESEPCYRPSELQGILNSLKAASQILVVSAEGMGKSFLLREVYGALIQENYRVLLLQPATPKVLMTSICDQLGVSTKSVEGRSLTVESLRAVLDQELSVNPAVLIFDDAHFLESKFRLWLKHLKTMGIPLLLAASNPPRTDIFVYLPRIELQPLPDYQIRDLMEREATELGANLKPYQIARLQSQSGGNPMLAKRAVEEGFLGIQNEAGDHGRYFDITPLILLVGIVFVAYRFIGLGTGNKTLYIFSGIIGAVFLGLSRILYGLPKESRRINS